MAFLDSSRREADGPGDVYQIDAAVADIYLVSRYGAARTILRYRCILLDDRMLFCLESVLGITPVRLAECIRRKSRLNYSNISR